MMLYWFTEVTTKNQNNNDLKLEPCGTRDVGAELIEVKNSTELIETYFHTWCRWGAKWSKTTILNLFGPIHLTILYQ